MKRRSLPGRLARWLINAILSAGLVSILAVALLRWLPVPVTAFMLHERSAASAEGIVLRQQHRWVSRERIARAASLAVIAAEDQKFYLHDGFDFAAIEKAVTDAQGGRRLRGASTISQQVAKNLFLWPGHSWPRKGLEAWFTVWIELFWPKRRILEVYLNSAQFGRGIWGVEAAAQHYFRKNASLLVPGEAALLAAVLPSPTRYRVIDPGPYVRARQAWILNQMNRVPRPAQP